MVASWDTAVELAPDDPLPEHLLGSFAFHVSALPWAAAAAMRQLAAGLRKFSTDDALRHLMRSEELMAGGQLTKPAPPRAYSLTNRSMIGRLLLQKGSKPQAREWLQRCAHPIPYLATETAMGADDGFLMMIVSIMPVTT